MIEEVLKNVENPLEYLQSAIKWFSTGEGEPPVGLEEQVEKTKPYFNEDKFLVESVKVNIRKLKDKFNGEDLERALAWRQADKTRRYLLQRLNEAIGFRMITKGNFNNYKIVAFRKEVYIRETNLLLKTNFKNEFFTLTTKEGFKESNNKYRKAILDAANNIIYSIRKKGYYDTNLTHLSVSDEEKGLKLDLTLACNPI